MTAEHEFLDALRAAGLEPVKHDLVLNGRLHRYRVAGDKAGSKNGWYVGHLTPIPAGAFGSWRTGESHTWKAETDQPQTKTERAELRRQFEEMRMQRQVEEANLREAARAKAERLWQLAKPADPAHPYLVKKGVKSWGIRQLRNMLVIPGRDAQGQLHTLQFISPDGDKRFLTGGRMQGCYCAIGRPTGDMLIAEGYATAATVFEATGNGTACAFFAGNLIHVAKATRAKFPRMRIVVCADNDHQTPGNPGVRQATEAARAVNGWVAVPPLKVVH